MDEKEHYFPNYSLNTALLFTENRSVWLHVIHVYFEILSTVLIKDIELVIISNTIYFNILNSISYGNYGTILYSDENLGVYYKTPLTDIFHNISQEQWKDLINNNFELIENIIESYFNEHIGLETSNNLKSYYSK
jgi:hypothetical protein